MAHFEQMEIVDAFVKCIWDVAIKNGVNGVEEIRAFLIQEAAAHGALSSKCTKLLHDICDIASENIRGNRRESSQCVSQEVDLAAGETDA